MADALASLKPWVTFAGCVLVVVVLYWAQAVLIPVAVALLLTFVLTPPMVRLQRWIGRVPAALVTVALAFSVLGLAAWGVSTQMSHLVDELPLYRDNMLRRVAEVRRANAGNSVERVQQTLEEIKSEITRGEGPAAAPGEPLVVRSEQVDSLWGLPSWLDPIIGPLSTAGLIIVMVIFMLLEREDLRGRLIGLIGHGHLPVTTKAFDEAGRRVSRQLMMQTAVNAIYGVGVGVGLYLIGVPFPFLWASLAAALRFIPYVGPVIGAVAPIVIALAALPGWTRPLYVVGLFVGLELFTNMVLETVLYAGAAGVSQVALLVAVAFWTWLWGPMGLLMATPLTVCVVVLGKHVPGLEFLATLMADGPVLAPDVSYYQRLLARDQSEASDMIDRHVRSEPPDTVYDALLLPALNYAERDRLEGRLSIEEEREVVDATRELVQDALMGGRTARAPEPEGAPLPPSAGPERATKVLAYPANLADEIALQMLGHVLEPTHLALDVLPERLLPSDLVQRTRDGGYDIVCIADLPPSPPSKTRYLVKKLRAALPELTIVVGRWAPASLADDNTQQLIEAGATSVGSSLLTTRDALLQLVSAGEAAGERAEAPLLRSIG